MPAILGTIIFLYGGMVFIRGAQGELADRKPGMMTLISLAIIVAFVTSWAGTLGLFEVEIWWELATLITIMLLGPLARDAVDRPGAGRALGPRGTAAGHGRAGDCRRHRGSADRRACRSDDVVLVRPGARVPADGADRRRAPPTSTSR